MNLEIAAKKNLKRLLAERKMKQWTLAERVGCNVSQINHMVNGRRRIDIEWINRLSDALEISPIELVTPYEPEHESSKRVVLICRECKSTDIHSMSSSAWDIDQQRWKVVDPSFESSVCNNCGQTDSCDVREVTTVDAIISRCGTCNLNWTGAELREIERIAERVSAGDAMPSGQCPQCRSLCYVSDLGEHQ